MTDANVILRFIRILYNRLVFIAEVVKMPDSKKRSVGFECKHIHYVKAKDGSDDDLLVIKEYEHFSDGTTEPRLRMIKNFERPFYITRPNYRDHQEKKEWEALSRLQKFKSTQAKLSQNISRALGRGPGGRDNRLNVVCRSPYVYGADVTSAVLAKHHYIQTWPDNISLNTIAALDSEVDMLHDSNDIIMLSVTSGTKARLIVVKSFMDGISDPEKAIRHAADLYLKDVLEERKINLEIEFVRNAGECAARAIATAHEWKPDFLAAWNMNFDVPKMIECLEKYGYDINEVFSDPAIPAQYRNVRYVQGTNQKRTASGDVTPLHPAEQWHRLEAPASWYFIDPMCVYLRLRIASGKESSYALDYILDKHECKKKLKFEAADHERGVGWHIFMQRNYKAEYCIYNLYDSIALEILDSKTTDLSRQISSLTGHSEYSKFSSQPRRLCDDLHFFGLDRGYVIGSTSDQMEVELDQHIIGLSEWIVTLPSFLVAENGIPNVEELPSDPTMIFGHVADLD